MIFRKTVPVIFHGSLDYEDLGLFGPKKLQGCDLALSYVNSCGNLGAAHPSQPCDVRVPEVRNNCSSWTFLSRSFVC